MEGKLPILIYNINDNVKNGGRKMLKKRFVFALMLVLLSVSIVGCKGKGDNGDLNLKDTTKKTTINFWGWGEAKEVEIFRNLVNKFNDENEYNIKVNYTQKPSDGYVSSLEQILSGSRAPDVFLVGDGELKKWAKLGFLLPIDEYIKDSEVIDFTDMWESSISRYRYDVDNMTSDDLDPLYGLPKDIGPTVIYYNADAFESVGVSIISKAIDNPTITDAEKHGYNPDTQVFNNRIPMTWEESEALSKLLTKSYNQDSPTDFGYYTNWWFNYGWSVGGDAITLSNQGNYEFTLGNQTSAGVGKDGVTPLPSMRDAFEYFVSLSNDLKISPKPNTLNSVGKTNYFSSGKVAMMVDGRWAVVNLRNDADFNWDVAPLPKHKNGNVAGHSGSMAYGIWSNSSKPLASYKFIEFMAGSEGQTALAKTGFNVPNQISIANSDVFLQPDQKPRNAVVFLEAAEIQRPGDWTYLPDNAWIQEWAPTLNGSVLNGEMSVDDFFNQVTKDTNNVLKRYTNN